MHTIPYPVFCGFVLLAYFLPTITAFVREHRRLGWICLANIVFGWTVLGWALVALWAMSSRRHHRHIRTRKRHHGVSAPDETTVDSGGVGPSRPRAVVERRSAPRGGLVLPSGQSAADPFSPSLDDEFTPQWRHFSPRSVTELD